METLLRHIRIGLRMIAKTPIIVTVVVIALALGVGANTAIFSVVKMMLEKRPPSRSLDIQRSDAAASF